MAESKHKGRRSRTRSMSIDIQVLAIDSNYEPVTKAGFDYREKHVYPYLSQKGLTITKKQGALARRIYVAPECRKPGIDYLTGVGHGLYNTYTGSYGDEIFRVGDYSSEESEGKIVHFLSCQTAGQLGPDFVNHGCKAYFGYDENFTFIPKYQDIFFECDSEIDRAFADGLTAGEVNDRVIALFNKRIDELDRSGNSYVASILEFDRDHLRSPASGKEWGSKSVRLE